MSGNTERKSREQSVEAQEPEHRELEPDSDIPRAADSEGRTDRTHASDLPEGLSVRQRIPLKQELPLLIWLLLVWVALTGDVAPMNLIFGAAAAYAVVHLFRLPPVTLAGRFNPWYALLYGFELLGDAFRSSWQVFRMAVAQGERVRSSVVRVPLTTDDDLITTAVSHALVIVPGSVVVDIDRSARTLYVHVLGAETEEQRREFVLSAMRTEAKILRIMGSREEHARALDALAAAESGSSAVPAQPVAPAHHSKEEPCS